MLLGEFKQEVLRINNKVNLQVFGYGLLSQRVDVFHDKILITAKNRRVGVLSISQKMDVTTTETMDHLLIVEFKKRFIETMAQELGIKVLAHLKDYDPELEISVSVSILERPVEEIIADL